MGTDFWRDAPVELVGSDKKLDSDNETVQRTVAANLSSPRREG